MSLFDKRAVGLDDEEMRDTAAVQVERIAAVRFHDRELDVMFLRPRERLLVVLVAREVNELDVRVILQRLHVGLGNPRHLPAARPTPRCREEAKIELGALLEVLVEKEVTALKLVRDRIYSLRWVMETTFSSSFDCAF